MPEIAEAHGPELSRRALLTGVIVGASGLLAACAAPVAPLSAPTAFASGDASAEAGASATATSAADAAGTTATPVLASVRERATASVGSRRAGSPWEPLAPSGSWNLAFVTWLLAPGSTTAPVTIDALRQKAIADKRLGTTAEVGAIVLHDSGAPGDVSHVGFVEAITRYAIITVEGDVPGPIPDDQTFVRRFAHPLDSALTFYYPDYRA